MVVYYIINVNHSFKIVVWNEYTNYLEFILNIALLAILLLNWSILGLKLHEAQESNVHFLLSAGYK